VGSGVSRWPNVALRDVLTKSDDWIELDPECEYKEVTVRNRGQGAALRRVVTGAEIAGTRRMRVHHRQFIVSRIDARHGSTAVIPSALEGAIVTNDFPVFGCDERLLLPAYLGWYSKTPRFVDECRHASEGSTNRVRLKELAFLEITMPLPPIEEQRRVVEKLNRLASQVDKAGRHQRSIEAALSLASKSITAQTLRGMPDAIWTRLRDVVEIRGGNTPSKGNPAYWGGEVPWITPKDMKQRVLSDSEDHMTEVALSEAGSRLHEPGCVLVVVRGMILAHTFPAAVLGTSATINQDMKALRPTRGLLPEYLCHALWGFNDEILGLVDRSGHDTRKLTTGRLADFRFPMPPIADQRRVVRFLDRALSVISGLRVRQEHTQATMDVLLSSFVGNLMGTRT